MALDDSSDSVFEFESESHDTGFLSQRSFEESCRLLLRYGQDQYLEGLRFGIREEGSSQHLTIYRTLPAPNRQYFPNPPEPLPAANEICDYERAHEQEVFGQTCAPAEENEVEDEDDIASANPYPRPSAYPSVEYSIVLSPTYRVPVLYFTLHNLPHPLSPTNIDTVYSLLIPQDMRCSIEQVGIMGAISMGNHPITDFPSFYVHPCNTAEAMRELLQGRRPKSVQYLMIWLGLVGGCVGLYIPKEIALAIAQSRDP